MHPHFTRLPDSDLDDLDRSVAGSALAPLVANLRDFAALAETEERHLGGLTERVAPSPVVRVPELAGDVHDLTGLADIGIWLFGTEGDTAEHLATP
jgi:hypothetical protein